MANVKKGNLTPAPQWWKHLDWAKRVFWKSERQAHKEAIKQEVNTPMCMACGRAKDDLGEHYCNEKHGAYE